MKTIRSYSYSVLTSLLLGWLIGGCNPADKAAIPQGSCRIQQYTAVSTSRFYTDNRQTAYSYDGQGNLLKIATTYDRKPLNGADGQQTSTTTDTFVYDSDGYLTTSTENTLTTTVFAGKTRVEPFTFISNYSYTNGHLTAKSDTYKTPYSSSNAPSITTYEYDSAGDLTKVTRDFEIWTYQKNQLVDYVQKSGTTERRPYTIQNGLIVKAVYPGDTDELVTMDSFDNQKRLIKHEEYLNGQLNRYSVQTWADAKPATASLPPFNGFPPIDLNSISLSLQALGQKGVLATYKQYYGNSINKTMQQFSDDTYSVQANGQGFVTGAATQSKHPLAADQDYTATETYTYTGCQ